MKSVACLFLSNAAVHSISCNQKHNTKHYFASNIALFPLLITTEGYVLVSNCST